MSKPVPYQYIVAHSSLKNHPGVLACQVGHAASESLLGFVSRGDTHIVALEAETSEDLEQLGRSLQAAGVPHVVIHEPDAPYFGTATAVGVQPTFYKQDIRPLFAHFKLLKRKDVNDTQVAQ